MGEPCSEVAVRVSTVEKFFELLLRRVAVLSQPVHNFVIESAMPALVAMVGCEIGGPGDESRISS